MKTGIIMMAIGLILATSSILLSKDAGASYGSLLRDLQRGNMFIVINEGHYEDLRKEYLKIDSTKVEKYKDKYIYEGGFIYKDERGFYRPTGYTGENPVTYKVGRKIIRTKYPLGASVIITIIGMAMFAISLISKPSSQELNQ